MELYYAPLACSLVARVVAAEAGLPLELRQIELYAKTLTADGRSYRAIAPLGLVPVLRLPDGALLTELPAVVQYLADLAPERGLAPPWGSLERYRMIEWLSFVATELHKKIVWVHYSREVHEVARAHAFDLAPPVLDHLERSLGGRAFLVGDRFTVADAYLVWALELARIGGLDVSTGRPALAAYRSALRQRPSVRDAFAAETPEAVAAMARQPV